MIEELWTALKAKLLEEGGHDRLLEFLDHAVVVAEIEQDKLSERDRSFVQ